VSGSGDGVHDALPGGEGPDGAVQAVTEYGVIEAGHAQPFDIYGVFNGGSLCVDLGHVEFGGLGADGVVLLARAREILKALRGLEGEGQQTDQGEQSARNGEMRVCGTECRAEGKTARDESGKADAAVNACVEAFVALVEADDVIKVTQGFVACSLGVGCVHGRVPLQEVAGARLSAQWCGVVAVPSFHCAQGHVFGSWLAPWGLMVVWTFIIAPRGAGRHLGLIHNTSEV